MADSEAERQILGVACGVAINQCPEADLMSNSSTAEPFGHDPDHNSEHGSSAANQSLHASNDLTPLFGDKSNV